MSHEEVLSTYEQVGPEWSRLRSRTLFERRWLDRFIACAPAGAGKHRRVLDLGCGTGIPLASYMAERGCLITGVDGAASMVTGFRANLPNATVHHADMRGLDLGETFDAILAWDSFFHLNAADQRAMFPVFAAHAADRAALMFTTGDHAGTAIGDVGGSPIFHESLDPDDYRELLDAAGFDVLDFKAQDPDCGGHTIWLARAR
ncbi:class I SAM-dependent methyltransferase [Pelagovum pacificum]|uniref:Class I SAM-dependent methyltransferase n=1 Tax=Pelagovum pacificum TaxID=2588711 RepID=A0A5C5GBG8_9RHOB|nr:class I SAM-dependent methyltransferase [Pelagovum pacificum]QQA44737.1 class I SAM-dependent methyltransferase [Pelagovum pacificum]TNY32155.1 class I SAM-dependent methyltransferase [Pelagovum pacificum]